MHNSYMRLKKEQYYLIRLSNGLIAEWTMWKKPVVYKVNRTGSFLYDFNNNGQWFWKEDTKGSLESYSPTSRIRISKNEFLLRYL